MDCPRCGAAMAAYPVPAGARTHAPDGAEAVVLCPACLTASPADGTGSLTETGGLEEALPPGGVGGGMAVALGLLADSVALNSDAILALFDLVADAGADPWLVLERLDADPGLAADLDVDRAYRQLQQLA